MSAEDFSAKQIEHFKKLLQQQKQNLIKQLEQTEQDSKPVTLDQQSVGRVSRVDAIQQQQMAVANRQQANALLLQINASLGRITKQEYGYCLECGEAIEIKRLEAQPFSPNCLACQSALENR